MKKTLLIVLVSLITVVLPSSLSAQLGASKPASGEAKPAFFTDNENILYQSSSMGGSSEGEVTEIEIQGNKIVLNVFIPAKPNPNMPPWYEPKDENIEMTVLFENNKYYFEHSEFGKMEGVLNDYSHRKELSFSFDEGAIDFYVNK